MPAWTPPESATTLLLVRHGATEHSGPLRFSGRNDLPLDEVGERQAAALAASLVPADAVVSSPLRRAVQTAEAIASALGRDVQVVADLAELDFGAFEGLTMAEASAAFPEEVAAWAGSPDIAPPGGESFTALAERVCRARDAVLGEHRNERVVVVTHVTPIKTLLRLALDAPPSSMFRLHLDVASVSRVDYLADGTPSVRLVNETSHLRR